MYIFMLLIFEYSLLQSYPAKLLIVTKVTEFTCSLDYFCNQTFSWQKVIDTPRSSSDLSIYLKYFPNLSDEYTS